MKTNKNVDFIRNKCKFLIFFDVRRLVIWTWGPFWQFPSELTIGMGHIGAHTWSDWPGFEVSSEKLWKIKKKKTQSIED